MKKMVVENLVRLSLSRISPLGRAGKVSTGIAGFFSIYLLG
jgi:hypothetical protein